jgi:hypothetical protein
MAGSAVQSQHPQMTALATEQHKEAAMEVDDGPRTLPNDNTDGSTQPPKRAVLSSTTSAQGAAGVGTAAAVAQFLNGKPI